MSAPIQDHRASGGSSVYAPKRASPEQDHARASAQTREPVAAPEFSEPPWKRTAVPPFCGDVANVALRRRLAETSEHVPEPLFVEMPRANVPFRRLLGTMVVLGVASVSYWWGSGTLPEMMMRSSPSASAQTAAANIPKRVDTERVQSAERRHNGDAATAGLATPAAPPFAAADAPAAAASLLLPPLPTIVETGVSTQPAPRGLAPAIGSPGTSAPVIADPTSTGERTMAPSAQGGAASGAKAATRKLGAAETDLMIERGSLFMANGNVAAARMILQPAAEAGAPAAALALAETFDPLVLDRLGAKGGIMPDVALAHAWYERARAGASRV